MTNNSIFSTDQYTNICRACGNGFKVYGKNRNTADYQFCPTCTDRRQNRPTVVLSREIVAEFPAVRIESLPDAWQPFRAKNADGCWKIDTSGKVLSAEGGKWEGRIVMYADRPITPGVICNMRVMKTIHETGSGDSETREYIVLEPQGRFPQEAQYRLLWAKDVEEAAWAKVITGTGGSMSLVVESLPHPNDDDVFYDDEYDDGEYLDSSTLAKLRAAPQFDDDDE